MRYVEVSFLKVGIEIVLTFSGNCVTWPTVWYPHPGARRNASEKNKLKVPRLRAPVRCAFQRTPLGMTSAGLLIESSLSDAWRSYSPRIRPRSPPRCGDCRQQPTATLHWAASDRVSTREGYLPGLPN